DQGGGLEGLPRLLLGQLLRRQLAQLVVDQRQELAGGVRVALLDGAQDAGHVGHSGEHTARVKRLQRAGGGRAARPRADPSFTIVPVPRHSVTSAVPLLPSRSREKDSSATRSLSPLTSVVWPSARRGGR